MSLSLKLELKSNNRVLVTNLNTNESYEVALSFIQNATHNSLSMLIQYKYYELLLNTETIWRIVKQSNIQAEVKKESLKSKNSISLILKLELKANNNVLVTNLQTNESRQVTLSFLQRAANDSLTLLVQNKRYELFINAEKVWQRVQHFDIEAEKIQEIELEQEFKRIMANDQWLKITDYDRDMYHKALASWANTYNSHPHKSSFDQFVFVPVAGGAIAGALTYSTIGGMGIAAAGTAFGVGALGWTALGTIGGLAAYGVGKAIS